MLVGESLHQAAQLHGFEALLEAGVSSEDALVAVIGLAIHPREGLRDEYDRADVAWYKMQVAEKQNDLVANTFIKGNRAAFETGIKTEGVAESLNT